MDSLRAGDVVAGKLRVIRLVGAGGMGAVYEVEHLFTHHTRALKLLHPSIAEASTTRERFLREATAAGRIGSPHVVETFDAGILDDGAPFLLMELLSGQSLDELLESQGALDLDFCVELFWQVCDGVQAAHDAGIIHRDLKPENLFITSLQGKPFVKILDFGISKFEELEASVALTREGALLGTPLYMAPEQLLRREPASVESDIYALGVIAYQCLTGKRPFEAESLPELSVRVSQGSYESLDTLRDDLPPQVVAAVAKAMSSDPSERFHTAREFLVALEARGTLELKPEPHDSSSRAPGVLLRVLGVGLVFGLLGALGFALSRAPAESPATGSAAAETSRGSVLPAELGSTAPPSTSAAAVVDSGPPSSSPEPRVAPPPPPATTSAPRGATQSQKLRLDTANPY